MTGLHKTAKKFIPKEARTPLDKKIGEENIRTHESLSRRLNPEMPVVDDRAIPIPDEDELARDRRKKNSRRRGGRASTVLTDDDRLGG